jgi:hypothetical protein
MFRRSLQGLDDTELTGDNARPIGGCLIARYNASAVAFQTTQQVGQVADQVLRPR